LATRPIDHQSDAAIRGHVFCSFLALVLRKELENRLAAAGLQPEWAKLLADLDRLQEIEVRRTASASSCAPRQPASPARCSRPSAPLSRPTSAKPTEHPGRPDPLPPPPPSRGAKTSPRPHNRLK
jgi:hypothetical protein